MPQSRRNRSTRKRGFTAFEALIAITILAFLTAAVSGALMAGRQQSKLARDTLNASMLGKAMMDEVMRLPTADPNGLTTMGPNGGQTRKTYDSVKCYHGYMDGPGNVGDAQGAVHPITDLAGTVYPDVYQSFVRAVTVTPVSYAPAGWGQTITGLLVTVTVTRDGGGASITLQRVAYY